MPTDMSLLANNEQGEMLIVDSRSGQPLESFLHTLASPEVATPVSVYAASFEASAGEIAFFTSVIFTVGALVGYIATKRRGRQIEQERSAEEVVDEPTERTISHQAKELVLSNILGDVAIETGSDEMTVNITGKQSRVNKLRVTTTPDSLTLTDASNPFYVFGVPFPKGRCMRKVWKLLKLEIMDEDDIVNVQARVPAGTTLKLDDINGDVRGRGRFGDVDISASYRHTVQLDHVGEAVLCADSSSRIAIESVTDNLEIDAGYNSSVNVKSGVVQNLKATLDSSSRVRFDGEAQSGSIDCGYNSHATVGSISGIVTVETDSSSSAHILQGEATKFIGSAGYNSGIFFDGNTQQASIELDSSSKARIGSVTQYLKLEAGYNSRAEITRGDIHEVDIDTDSSSAVEIGGRVMQGRIDAGYGSRVQAQSFGRGVSIEHDYSSKIITTGL